LRKLPVIQVARGNIDSALAAYAQVLERVPVHEEAAAFIAQNGG
jgi:TolA-binding protein